MNRRMTAAATGVAVLAFGALGLWRWGPFSQEPAVPSCSQLAEALPGTVEGTWTVKRAEPNREVSDTSARCELTFASADSRFTGEVSVFLLGSTDNERLLNEARNGRCNGNKIADPDPGRYAVTQYCVETINTQTRAGVFATLEERLAHTVVGLSSSSASQEELVTYATDTARRVTDRAMSLAAED